MKTALLGSCWMPELDLAIFLRGILSNSSGGERVVEVLIFHEIINKIHKQFHVVAC